MRRYDHHEATAILPTIDGNALAELTADVRENGLAHPIVLHEGKVLDGRARQQACLNAGVEPRYVEWGGEGSPMQWVVAVNIEGRGYTQTQKAALALGLIPELEKEATRRARANLRGQVPQGDLGEPTGKSAQVAADVFGVGRSSVERARGIQDRDPAVFALMLAGSITTNEAARRVGMHAHNRDPEIGQEYFGKGDKWEKARQPMLRYLKGQQGRGFTFTHLNPREAGKRIEQIDEFLALLNEARVGLEPRAVRARLALGRKERSAS